MTAFIETHEASPVTLLVKVSYEPGVLKHLFTFVTSGQQQGFFL